MVVTTASVSPFCCDTCRPAHLGGHARVHGVPRVLHDARGLLWARSCGARHRLARLSETGPVITS